MERGNDDNVRREIRIHGRVQGVFFRASTREEANRLGLKGWVRNEPDGSVLALAEGPPRAVESLVDWCRHGPPRARVERVDTAPAGATGELPDPFAVAHG